MAAEVLAGFHGKVPARGDFVTRNLPRSFVTSWDEWLQGGMAASREKLGEGWLPIYLESPIWRFVLTAGVCGPEAWIGVLMPSVDRVGRYFPLTIAVALDTSAHPLTTALASPGWFDAAEALAVRALDDDHLDLESFVAAVGELGDALSPSSSALGAVLSDVDERCTSLEDANSVGTGLAVLLDRMLMERDRSYTLWWTSGGVRGPGHCCLLPHLPSSDRFSHLLTGSVVTSAPVSG